MVHVYGFQKKNITLRPTLSCIFLFKNAVSNPISVSGIHIGLQRILDFLRLGNNFAGEEQQMSLDSFAVPLTKKGLLNKQTFCFSILFFFNIYFILFFLNLVIMKRRENTQIQCA